MTGVGMVWCITTRALVHTEAKCSPHAKILVVQQHRTPGHEIKGATFSRRRATQPNHACSVWFSDTNRPTEVTLDRDKIYSQLKSSV